jgi:hypothetical protein
MEAFDVTLIPKYSLVFIVVAAIISILYYSSTDPTSLTTNTYIYVVITSIPLLAMMYYAVPIFSSNENGSSLMIMGRIFVFALIFLSTIYFYSQLNANYFELFGYLSGFLVALIVLMGLAMIFYMLSNYFKSFTGWSGFVVYFIFYIPCLLIDFFRYIMKEFQLTAKIIYILFVVEILLILLYIFIPRLIDNIDKKNGIVLLENGAFLDIYKVIGTNNILRVPDSGLENKNVKNVYNKNYAFSMWIFLNARSNNFIEYAKETPIFDCGNGKPKIVYINNANDNKPDKYIIYFTDNTKGPASYEITLPNQKWNNFVFNYTFEKVDLFINGELVRTFAFNNNEPTYKVSDNISVGTDNGIDGAICNVRYYPHNLTTTQITRTYNLLMYKNPPVFIL